MSEGKGLPIYSAIILTTIFAVAFLLFDLWLPLGVAGGVPYVAVVLMGWWYPRRRHIFLLATVSSILVFIGYLYSPEGGVPWVVLTNRALAYAAIWTTAVLLAQVKQFQTKIQEVRESETKTHSRLLDAIESLPGAFAIFDDEERLVLTNSKALEMFPHHAPILKAGTTYEEIVRTSVKIGMIKGDLNKLEAYVQERLQAFRNIPVHYEHQWADGRWFSVSQQQTSEGGTVSLRLDITERKQAEEKIRLQQKQLIQADKLASLGTLVSGVAYEINNPNAIITLNAPSLKEFWKDALPILDAHQASNGELTLGSIPYDRIRDDIPAMLDDIQGGSDRIRVIVDNLKNFARQGVSGERRAVSLNKVVQSAVVLVGARIRKATNHFHSELSDDLPLVEGNLQELEQVVINLLTNSCDALTDTEKAISISTVFDQKNHRVMIVLADEGEGIPQDNISRIKDPFFTTKQELGGTGLGLSVSHGIIESHNGSLEFSCPPEGGTVATITLPLQTS